MERQRIFEPAPFAQCHAATLAATGRGLVAAWFSGTAEGEADVGIWSATRQGPAWSAPVRVVTGADAAGMPSPCWNPVLWSWPDGRLTLFYKVGPSPRDWWGMVMHSPDAGASWGEPEPLPRGILGPIKNKPVLLEGGRLLCPSSGEDGDRGLGWSVHFEWTDDGGRRWERGRAIGGGEGCEIIQPAILGHGDGRLQALCRGRQGRIVETWSKDGGRRWSAPQATALPNPNSGIDAATLADGRQLLVYNPTISQRSPLALALSSDGKSWRTVLTLESGEGEFSYPAIVAEGDDIHIAYTRKRETIVYVKLGVAEIAGVAPSEVSSGP